MDIFREDSGCFGEPQGAVGECVRFSGVRAENQDSRLWGRFISGFKAFRNGIPNLNQVSPKTRSRADKKPGVLRLPCKRVEAKSTVNCGMFDLRLYCPSTWVHTSYLVLLPQLAQLLLKVYSTGR